MRRGIVLFGLVIAVAIAMQTPLRAAQTPTGIATDPILQPPPYNGQPLDVAIGLHVVNIASIPASFVVTNVVIAVHFLG